MYVLVKMRLFTSDNPYPNNQFTNFKPVAAEKSHFSFATINII